MPHRAIQLGRHTGRRSGRSNLHRMARMGAGVPDRSVRHVRQTGFPSAPPLGTNRARQHLRASARRVGRAMDAAATAALWTTVGVILLAALAVSWYTHLLIRKKWRKRSLQFAQSLLDNADTIKEGLAAGYNFAECLVVLEAFYKARTPSDMLDSQSLAGMIHKRREDSARRGGGTDSVPSSVYTRLRHLVGIDKLPCHRLACPRRPGAHRPGGPKSSCSNSCHLCRRHKCNSRNCLRLPRPVDSVACHHGGVGSAEQLVECAVAAGFARHLAHQCVAQVRSHPLDNAHRAARALRLLLLLERRRQEHAQFAAFERLSSVAEMGQPVLDKLSTQLGAPHAVLLSALYATAMSPPGTPRAMAGPPSAAHGHGHGHGRGRGHDCRGGGSGEGGRADALSDRTLATPSPLWLEQVERDEGEAVLGSFRRAEERWRQVRGFVPVLGAAHGPWQQQQLQRQLQPTSRPPPSSATTCSWRRSCSTGRRSAAERGPATRGRWRAVAAAAVAAAAADGPGARGARAVRRARRATRRERRRGAARSSAGHDAHRRGAAAATTTSTRRTPRPRWACCRCGSSTRSPAPPTRPTT